MRETGVGERSAQVVLLVRAFEESDPEGLVLPRRERETATRRALMVTGLAQDGADRAIAGQIRHAEAITRRARLLDDALCRLHPPLHRVLRLSELGSSTLPVLLAGAFLAGLAGNALGPQRQINLLSLPLLGLLLWNAAIYLGLALFALRRSHREGDGPSGLLAGMLLKSAVSRRVRSSHVTEGGTSSESRIIVRAVMRFAAMWHRLAGDLLAARVKRMFHLAAIAMIVGLVIGMYVRGLAFEYRATWESTWLEAPRMQALMDLLLGPAAWIARVEVPEVAPLRGPAGSGPAAPWIHLYALTALLFVGVPRGLLAAWQSRRAARLGRSIPLDLGESYYRRLFTAWRGSRRNVVIVPYSHTPRPGATAALKSLLLDYFGARADLRLTDPLPYGGAPGEALPAALVGRSAGGDAEEPRELCVVVLFNAAQPAESEVHGRFLERLTGGLDDERARLLVVLDLSSYRERIDDASRVRERTEAWSRVVREAGLIAVPLDLELQGAPVGANGSADDEPGQDPLGAVRAAMWPTREEARSS